MSRCGRKDSCHQGLPFPIKSYKLNAISKVCSTCTPGGKPGEDFGGVVRGHSQMCGIGYSEKGLIQLVISSVIRKGLHF